MSMTIILDNAAIEEALKGYIISQGIITSGKDITVNMIAGRGENGYKAEIVLSETVNPAYVANTHEDVKLALTEQKTSELLKENKEDKNIEGTSSEVKTEEESKSLFGNV